MIEREAERLIAATAADFRISGARAFYSPSGDFVQVPPPSRSTGTARPSMNLAIGPAISPVSIANIPVRSARNPMPAKNWSPRWPAPSSVHRSASCPPSGMPITSARGSRCCARTIARHRPRCQCRVQGRRLHSRLSVGHAAACGNLPRG
jgi:hypothetical protein